MSKKKRSKILATLLCATTMAAFYVSPQIGYAVDLYYKNNQMVDFALSPIREQKAEQK